MFEEDRHEIDQIPITKARAMLGRLPEMLAKENRAVALTRRGKPVLAVIPWDHFESAIETAEVMADPEAMDAIRKSMDGINDEDLIPIEEVEARLEGAD